MKWGNGGSWILWTILCLVLWFCFACGGTGGGVKTAVVPTPPTQVSPPPVPAPPPAPTPTPPPSDPGPQQIGTGIQPFMGTTTPTGVAFAFTTGSGTQMESSTDGQTWTETDYAGQLDDLEGEQVLTSVVTESATSQVLLNGQSAGTNPNPTRPILTDSGWLVIGHDFTDLENQDGMIVFTSPQGTSMNDVAQGGQAWEVQTTPDVCDIYYQGTTIKAQDACGNIQVENAGGNTLVVWNGQEGVWVYPVGTQPKLAYSSPNLFEGVAVQTSTGVDLLVTQFDPDTQTSSILRLTSADGVNWSGPEPVSLMGQDAGDPAESEGHLGWLVRDSAEGYDVWVDGKQVSQTGDVVQLEMERGVASWFTTKGEIWVENSAGSRP